jgi:choice-of-anchor B domain-containing protein
MFPALRPASIAALALLLVSCGGDTPSSPDSVASSDPRAFNMQLMAHLDLPTLTGEAAARGSGNWGYTSPDRRRFALTGTSVGLSIDEVTTPSRPRHIALIPGPESDWREVKTFREYAYVTTEAAHGLDVIDLREPDRPVKVQTWSATFASAHTICIDEVRGLAFVNGTRTASRVERGMRVLSLLPDPGRPREIGSFESFYIHDCMVRGTTLYASAIYDGILAMIDVSDPSRPREITRFATGRQFTHNSSLTVDGRYLFTTDEVSDAPLEGWDLADPFRPVKVSEYIGAEGTVPHNVLVDGMRLLVAHYVEGVHLLDIADPRRPRLIGRYDTLPEDPVGAAFQGAWGAYIFPRSNLIVASDIRGGLFVLTYTGP